MASASSQDHDDEELQYASSVPFGATRKSRHGGGATALAGPNKTPLPGPPPSSAPSSDSTVPGMPSADDVTDQQLATEQLQIEFI
jgi:hypothetical protein